MKEYLYRLAVNKAHNPLDALMKALLYFLSLVYASLVRALICFYKIRPLRPGLKVISIGNITLGGTGKTSITEYVAAYLASCGHKVAIVSRGYRRGCGSSSGGKQDYQALGDEPCMLARKLKQIPVIVDKDRLRALRRAVREHNADTAVMDDAMQQWRIHKDLELVSIDALNPFGNYRLLPAGFLREPLSGLGRADVFVLTRCEERADLSDLLKRLRQLNPHALVVEAGHSPQGFYFIENEQEMLQPDLLKGKPAVLISAIGNPGGFEYLADKLGIDAVLSFRFSDHHHYSQQDLDRIIEKARGRGLQYLVTTEKDAVRMGHLDFKGMRVAVLVVKLAITKNEEEFKRRLLKLYTV